MPPDSTIGWMVLVSESFDDAANQALAGALAARGGSRDTVAADTVTGHTATGRRAAGSRAVRRPARAAGGGSRHAAARLRPARGWLLGTIAGVTGIAGAAVWIGPAPIMAPWDVFTLLNGAYRIYEGQAPSTDFSNPIGPLVYGLTAIGMHLQHAATLRAVTDGQVIFLVIAAILAWMVSWRRLPPLYAAAFTVLVALLAVSVRPLGYSPWITTYAMLYNRYGWLLYSTLLLLVLLKRVTPGRKESQAADGFLLGLILGLLFYDKITFFLAALVAVGLGVALRTLARSLWLWAAALGGFLVIATAVRVLFGLHTTAYLQDVIEAAKVQAASQRTGDLAHAIVWAAPAALVAALIVGGLLRAARARGEPLAPLLRLSAAASFVFGSSVLISAGDASERSDLPALVVVPLLLVAFLRPGLPRWAGGERAVRAGTPGPAQLRRLLLIGLAVLLVGTTGPIVGKDLISLGVAASSHGYDAHPPASQQFSSARLQDFVIPADSQWQTAYRTAGNIPAMVNNGLSLLRRDVRPGDTVFALAYTNPFTIALGLPLSRCGPLWWDLGYDFDQQHHPTAACAIGTADWVIIPRMVAGQGCCQQTVSVMLNLYAGYLAQHYRTFAQTPDWILLRRTS